jgi:hypothetical protein
MFCIPLVQLLNPTSQKANGFFIIIIFVVFFYVCAELQQLHRSFRRPPHTADKTGKREKRYKYVCARVSEPILYVYSIADSSPAKVYNDTYVENEQLVFNPLGKKKKRNCFPFPVKGQNCWMELILEEASPLHVYDMKGDVYRREYHNSKTGGQRVGNLGES